MTKVHHSLIDGVAGVEMLAALFDLEADAAARPGACPRTSGDPITCPGDAEMLARAVVAIAQRPAKVVRAVSNLGSRASSASRAGRATRRWRSRCR